MKRKKFLITLDTEADNQWDPNQPPTTKNAKYLPRFQELCEKYGLKPTWLTTYEMANNPFFVEYFKDKQNKGLCEIGMHLHAWNTPPDYELPTKTKERSYLIEYPEKVMEAKIANITEFLIKKFGKSPVSHRSGRWATNETYFKLLAKYGYKIDCSVTPGVNWHKSLGTTGLGGTDYSYFPHSSYYIYDNVLISNDNLLESSLRVAENRMAIHKSKVNKILELPVTIEKLRFVVFQNIHSLKNAIGELYRFCKGRMQWLRPAKNASVKPLLKVINAVSDNPNRDYAMFMIHSSELMPGGSPSFQTVEDIEKLYICIEELFRNVKKMNYEGLCLNEYLKTIS